MSRLSAKITSRLILVVAVFVPSLLAVAAVGIKGLRTAAASADVLYIDNMATLEATSEVADLLDTVYLSSESVLVTTDAEDRAAIRTRLFGDELPALDVALAQLREVHEADDEAELAFIDGMIEELRTFRERWVVGRTVTDGGDVAADSQDLAEHLGGLRVLIQAAMTREHEDGRIAYDDAVDANHTNRNVILLITLGALAVGVTAMVVIVRRVVPRALAPEEDQSAFAEIMQVAEDEADAHDLLKRHIERTVPDSSAAILNRNNSANRLEAVTQLVAGSPLQHGLDGAGPRACLAVRTAWAQTHDHRKAALLACGVCGDCEGVSLCTPLTVGGEVIGSVLVNHQRPLDDDEERRVRESVTQAAPVLANLRNLAVAELRAATDSLTGLPNRRAVGDTLKRMVAQASRNVAPLAALLIDLDHFKQINDQFGHGHGDDVLAAVGAVLGDGLRASDFAGRQGGEEFLVLLPDTGLEAAVHAADKLRAAMSQIFIPQVERKITASIGVALLPDHAGDGDALLRAADRALYVAKGNGRDRTEVAEASGEVSARR